MDTNKVLAEYDLINGLIYIRLADASIRVASTSPHVAYIDLDDQGNLIGIELEGIKVAMDKPTERPLAQEEMQEAAKNRSPNHNQLTPEEQWLEDKQPGILDWEGGPCKPEP